MRALLLVLPLLAVVGVVVLAAGVLDPDLPVEETSVAPAPEPRALPEGRAPAIVAPPPPAGVEDHGLTPEEILALEKIAVLRMGDPLPPPFPGARRLGTAHEVALQLRGQGPVTADEVLAALTEKVFLRVRSARDLDRLQELEGDAAWRVEPVLFPEVIAMFHGLGFRVEDHGHVLVLAHPETQAEDGDAPR